MTAVHQSPRLAHGRDDAHGHDQTHGKDDAHAAPIVQVASGMLSAEELAAVAVAVASVHHTSVAEAEARELASRTATSPGAWSDPAYLARPSSGRSTAPTETAWIFAHRH